MLRGFTCKLCTSFSFGHLNWTHESFGSIVCEGEVLSGQGVTGFCPHVHRSNWLPLAFLSAIRFNWSVAFIHGVTSVHQSTTSIVFTDNRFITADISKDLGISTDISIGRLKRVFATTFTEAFFIWIQRFDALSNHNMIKDHVTEWFLSLRVLSSAYQF